MRNGTFVGAWIDEDLKTCMEYHKATTGEALTDIIRQAVAAHVDYPRTLIAARSYFARTVQPNGQRKEVR